MPRQRAIVLSDLHLGPGGSLTIFRDAVGLADFLRRLAEPGEPPTELVLAGDVFDFLQCEGYDGFSAKLAPERLASILRGKQTAEVIGALGEFAKRPGHMVTVLSGNHDPEMMLPEVRIVFERAIGRVGAVFYPDDVPIVPRDGDKLPVWGRVIGSDASRVWVVHGDRWDTSNAIDREALVQAARKNEPFQLPAGSHLVFEVLSHLQPGHGWIVELKPELPTVLPLLLWIDPVGTRAYIERHWGIGWDLLSGFVDGALKRGPLFGPEGEGTTPESVPEQLAALLAEGIRLEQPSDPELLAAAVTSWIEKGPSKTEGRTLSAARGAGRALLAAWVAGVRLTDRFQALDGPDSTLGSAKKWLPADLVALVAGHTHGPRIRTDLRPAYYNTGTWIPVGSLPPGDVHEIVMALEGGDWRSDAPRTFVQIEWDDGPPTVHLGRCDPDGTPREVHRDRG